MRWIQRTLLLLLLLGSVLGGLDTACGEERLDREFQECPECPTMVAIPAGKFIMGSPASEPGRFDSEGPQHVVSLRAFALSKVEVTTAEFLTFLRETGYQPAPCDPILGLTWQSARRGRAYPPGETDPPLEPAVCLNWNDAHAYIAWLNGKVRGLPSARPSRDGPYRLPSEAEWEYAARAGTINAAMVGKRHRQSARPIAMAAAANGMGC